MSDTQNGAHEQADSIHQGIDSSSVLEAAKAFAFKWADASDENRLAAEKEFLASISAEVAASVTRANDCAAIALAAATSQAVAARSALYAIAKTYDDQELRSRALEAYEETFASSPLPATAPREPSSTAARKELAKSVFGGINALRWLLNITTEFDRKDVRTRQAARLLDQFFDKSMVTNRTHLEHLWKVLHAELSTADILQCLKATDAAEFSTAVSLAGWKIQRHMHGWMLADPDGRTHIAYDTSTSDETERVLARICEALAAHGVDGANAT